jgi:hypothetical protein
VRVRDEQHLRPDPGGLRRAGRARWCCAPRTPRIICLSLSSWPPPGWRRCPTEIAECLDHTGSPCCSQRRWSETHVVDHSHQVCEPAPTATAPERSWGIVWAKSEAMQAGTPLTPAAGVRQVCQAGASAGVRSPQNAHVHRRHPETASFLTERAKSAPSWALVRRLSAQVRRAAVGRTGRHGAPRGPGRDLRGGRPGAGPCRCPR